MRRNLVYIGLGSLLLISLTACSVGKTNLERNTSIEQGTTMVAEEKQDEIVKEIFELADADNKLEEVINRIDSNISLLSKEYAMKVINRLEEVQKSCLPHIEESFYETNDQNVEEFSKKIENLGFKVETAEGMYFPVIDYEFYKKYSDYVTDDMKAYIDIMAIESSKTPSKDAGLVISWEEVIQRALVQEEFIKKYPNSIKIDDIGELYGRYITFLFYGTNNTPLFHYDSKLLVEEAKQVYVSYTSSKEDSQLLQTMGNFLSILEKNSYKLTDQVEEFRKKASKNLVPTKKCDVKGIESNLYSPAGIVNATEFENTFSQLKDHVKKNNKKAVAEYIAYPIYVYLDGIKTEITTPDQFISKYDVIMNEKVKSALLNQNIKEAFVNDQGVMIGQGEAWINQLEKAKHKYCITTINNQI